jgi:hypothetical protein
METGFPRTPTRKIVKRSLVEGLVDLRAGAFDRVDGIWRSSRAWGKTHWKLRARETPIIGNVTAPSGRSVSRRQRAGVTLDPAGPRGRLNPISQDEIGLPWDDQQRCETMLAHSHSIVAGGLLLTS